MPEQDRAVDFGQIGDVLAAERPKALRAFGSRMIGAGQGDAENGPHVDRAAGVHRLDSSSTPLAASQIHGELVIGDDDRAGLLAIRDGVADMVAMAVGDDDMADALGNRGSTSPPKTGFPVKNGSIRMALPPMSRRKSEWPNQVIFISAELRLRDAEISRFGPTGKAVLFMGLRASVQFPTSLRRANARRCPASWSRSRFWRRCRAMRG